jgi:hypothetical protein
LRNEQPDVPLTLDGLAHAGAAPAPAATVSNHWWDGLAAGEHRTIQVDAEHTAPDVVG